jgi:geranylgeranyl diphosphate synthase type II
MKRLKLNKEAVDNYILNFLPKNNQLKEIKMLYDMMRDYPSRPGKGLRASLCILTCEALNGNFEKALPTAAALEIFQNWILIHDDIEDYSEMRRGEPVLHRKHGIPLAINTGDALHGKMWEVIMNNKVILSESKTLEIINELLRMINETTEGQHIELSWVSNNKWDIKEDDYYTMCTKKTSWYTCISPCRIGATIAEVNNHILEDFIPFGTKLGIAFQIQDDILNLMGDESKYGKERGGDLLEGKRTLMLNHLINNANSTDKIRVLKIMSKERTNRTQSEVDEILMMMERYGSIEFARSKARLFIKDAKDQFNLIFHDSRKTESKLLLSDLIDFMVKREW